jgi:hypothetical protein
MVVGELLVAMRDAEFVQPPHEPAGSVERPRLQPKDLRRDIAGLRSGEQIAGNHRIGLGHPERVDVNLVEAR